MSDTTATTVAPTKHLSFLAEAEALLTKYLPFLITGAEVGATVSGNPELDPVIAEAGGAAEATLDAAESAQDGQLAAAASSIATAVVQAKAAAGITGPVQAPAAPAAS